MKHVEPFKVSTSLALYKFTQCFISSWTLLEFNSVGVHASLQDLVICVCGGICCSVLFMWDNLDAMAGAQG